MAFGRLHHQPGTQPMSDINMTPLIDVMLVLMVIFLLTAPLLASSLQLALPHSEAAQPTSGEAAVQLALDKSGALFLNKQPVTLESLKPALQAVAQAQAQTEVQLRADEAVPYGRVVELMGVVQAAGLTRIGFVAKP